MFFLYHIITTTVFVLVLPLLPFLWVFSEKRRANLLQRLGFFTGIPVKSPGTRRIWVHALSVGEVNSAVPFVKGLKERVPDAEIVLSASTRTGFETARRLMDPSEKSGLTDSPVSVITYFPYDLWMSVRYVTTRIRPDLVCLVETDLWPGFLSTMNAKNIPVVLVNARLSERSLKGYLKLGRFASLFFSSLSHVMAQTKKDAHGFNQLGLPAEGISVTGNIKFDQPALALDRDEKNNLRERFGITAGQPVWIAGSTHEGEEPILTEIFMRVRVAVPDLKLIIAPRDPARSRTLMRALPQRLSSACLSDTLPAKVNSDVVFIDSLGELARAYAVCDLAFIGGSLVPLGGHNPLEPAMFGKPVLFGPYMTDFHEVADWLTDAGAAHVIDGVQTAEKTVMVLLTDAGRREQAGNAARDVFLNNSGAVENILDVMEENGFV
ncbi:MAG TPA: 3-deoxy-D-manno-octulosonic acid transferase [Desulfobacteraceae bacterium]|nr:3-deoxy-D-manno-octulosonic acid transferase [Desulfobacteraceae bacterium]